MRRLKVIAGGVPSKGGPTDEAVSRIFADWQGPDRPGGYVAILEGERLSYLKSFGVPCLEIASEWSERSRFRIYSVTMTFVAIAILMAEDRGLLSIEDDIRRYVPELPDYGHVITVHHLLDHSSGLRDNEAVQFLAGFVQASPCSIDYALELIQRQETLNFKPGARIQFSNSNYRLLALIIERVFGDSFESCLKSMIFDPLGMNDTDVIPVDGPIIRNAAFGYTESADKSFIHLPIQSVTTGDGGIVTSIRDLICWLTALRAGQIGVRNLIGRLSSVRSLGNGNRANYGLGVRVGTQAGLGFIGHGGEAIGYSCDFLHFTDYPLSVIVAANFYDANLEPRVHKVAELVLASRGITERPRKVVRGRLGTLVGWYANSSLPLAVEVGRAEEGEFGSDLMISASLGGLADDGTGVFHCLDGYTSLTARFVDQVGRRPMLELDFGDGAVRFNPVSPEYISPEEMPLFTGLFGNAEVNGVHRVYERDGRLFHLRGHGEWPLEQVREMQRIGTDMFVLAYPGRDFATLKFEKRRGNRYAKLAIATRDVPRLVLDRLPDPISNSTAVPLRSVPR